MSSKNIGRAKIFVEQKYRSSKNICRANRCANRPAEASCRTVPWDAPCSKNIIKSMVYHLFFFARTILLMNLFTQFWLSGGRHFGSGLLAGLTAGRPAGLTAGLPGEGPGGDILGLRGVPPGGGSRGRVAGGIAEGLARR